MICKASQRGGGGQLAAHLLNAHDNVRVEVADMRGSVARDLAGAFKEWYAQSTTTNCTKYLYSLSISPDQKQGRLTREQYFELIGRYEKSLGLAKQGRVVVFHEKKDKDGVAREHCHVVWSRIDARRGRAVTISFDRLKRLAISRAFARELGRTVPHGMEQPPGPARHAAKAANSNHAEMQQQERSGITKEERRADITAAWLQSRDGAGFAAALESRGYHLARGGRLSYTVIDRAGEVHGLGTLVAGVRSAEVKARLAASHPLSSLPPPDAVKQQLAAQREKLRTLAGKSKAAAGPSPDEQRAALTAQQQTRRQALEETRARMEARHVREQAMQHGPPRLVRPAAPQPLIVVAMQRLRAHFHPERAGQMLKTRQTAERRDLTRQERDLKTLEGRERRSLETRIKREDLRQLLAPLRRLTPLLDRLAPAMPRQPEAAKTAREPAGSLRQQFVASKADDGGEVSSASAVKSAAAEAARRAAERLQAQDEARREQRTPVIRPDH